MDALIRPKMNSLANKVTAVEMGKMAKSKTFFQSHMPFHLLALGKSKTHKKKAQVIW